MRYLSPFFVILSCGMHVFCCGIPLLLSVSSLGAMLGVSSSAFEIEWFEAIEDKVLLLSGLILLFTIFIQNFANKLECCDETGCSSQQTASLSKNLTFFALGLYLVNLVIFFVQH